MSDVIYLASSSPRRAELLTQLGIQFRTLQIDVDELILDAESPEQTVIRLAGEKALAGLKAMSEVEVEAASLVLGADTLIDIDGEILGKPADRDACRAMLARLSGREHEVLSAVALTAADGQVKTEISRNRVKFRPINLDELAAYCACDEPMDKAGSYAIQGQAAIFIENIQGSYSAIMGLPLFETAKLLKAFNYDLWNPHVDQRRDIN